jgi:hypothetical protein
MDDITPIDATTTPADGDQVDTTNAGSQGSNAQGDGSPEAGTQPDADAATPGAGTASVSGAAAPGTTAPPPAALPAGGVTLSDGRVAVVRRGKGRDMLEASRRSGTDLSRIQFDLLSVLTLIDGQPLHFDELMEMDMEDISELMLASGGAKTDFFRNPGTSSTSPQ